MNCPTQRSAKQAHRDQEDWTPAESEKWFFYSNVSVVIRALMNA